MATKRPAPRPNRGGEEFARTHYLDDEGSSTKKPRFDVRNPSALVPDAPEEDAVLEADEIGKRGQQTKRNAVNIDGYDSDSSNEGFDGRAEAKAKREGMNVAASKMEEESDMFADLDKDPGNKEDEEDLAGESKKKRKNVRFLETDEIEGQVTTSKSGGHVSADFSLNGKHPTSNGLNHMPLDKASESSSESDVDEEERADIMGQVDEEVGAGGKKEHAPKLDAFNMKSEQEEGRFDAQGNYVRKAADPDAVHDSWLDGVSKKDMKKAKEASDKRDAERRQKALEADAVLTSEILQSLIPQLERGETVLEALARLGRGKKGKEKQKGKWQRKGKSKGSTDDGGMEVDVDKPAEEDPAETRRREAVEAITGAADQLLTRGQTDIYDTEREMLVRLYGRETGEEWVEGPRGADPEDEGAEEGHETWEYRWEDARDGGEAHGPYGGAMMAGWMEAGYFADGVEFRRVGKDGEWKKDINFS